MATTTTYLDTHIPGMQKAKSTELFEKAIDEKNKMKEFLWLLKG
jgi:hypothetical protein